METHKVRDQPTARATRRSIVCEMPGIPSRRKDAPGSFEFQNATEVVTAVFAALLILSRRTPESYQELTAGGGGGGGRGEAGAARLPWLHRTMLSLWSYHHRHHHRG